MFPDRLKDITVRYKQALPACCWKRQEGIFRYLQRLTVRSPPEI